MLDESGVAAPELADSLRMQLLDWATTLASDARGLGAALADIDPLSVVQVAAPLIGLIIVTLAVHRVTRRVTDKLAVQALRHLPALHGRLAPLRGLFALVLVLLLGGLALAVALAAGYLASLVLFIEAGRGGDVASGYLAAFAVAGLGHLALHVFLAPSPADARLLPVDEASAHGWEQRLDRLVRIGAYGLLFVAPLAGLILAGLEPLVSGLVVLSVLVATRGILSDLRVPVAAWLKGLAQRRAGISRTALALVAPVWHWLAGGYALALAGIGLAGAPGVLQWTALASLWSVIVVLIGGFLGHWLSVLLRHRAVVPPRLSARSPMLEQRLSVWLPRLLAIAHGLIAAVVIGLLLEIWHLADLPAWLASAAGQAVIGAVAGVLGILLIALTAWLAAVSWIEDRLNPDTGHGEPGAREKTLLTLFRNALAIAIITIASMVVLSEIGIDIGPLIAGAGVIGLAIGFGAQKLVQDIITGVFIQLEDAIHQDDFITAAGISGTVERLSIRSLGLRDLTGTLHVVPFSSVDTVSNYTRDFGYHLGEYGVAYRENIGDVIEHLHKAYERLQGDARMGGEVTGPLEVDGVTALADSSVNVRVRIRTTAGMQWAVGRAYNRFVKEVFDEAGIEIPFPHMTLYFGEDKQGGAPPAHLILQQEGVKED